VNWPKKYLVTLIRGAACCCLCTALFSANSWSAPHVLPDSSKALDTQIATTLSLIAEGDLAQARLLARQMAYRFPDYALGQLISAELETTAAFNDVLTASSKSMSQPLMALLLEAQARLSQAQAPLDTAGLFEPATLPDNIIQIGAHTGQLLLIDLKASVLYQVMGNDQSPTLVQQHYIGGGKAGYGKQVEGDNKTPLGVYSITGLRTDASLPDLYGSGALMLDYPNTLDRHLGRTGSGIWLHGVPHAQRSRSPRSSEGCVTMSNDHLLRLKNQITPSDALVVLGHDFQWSSHEARSKRQKTFQRLFEQFQQGWVNKSRTQLESLYADKNVLENRFRVAGGYQIRVTDTDGIQQNTENLQRLNQFKHFFEDLAMVNSGDISMTMNPVQPVATPDDSLTHLVMQVRFGLVNEHQVTLYWSEVNDGTWRIVAEQWTGLDI